MIRRDLSPAEVRVLGCLIEKQRTTPDQYPLSRNSLRLACSQSTNRDPVVEYEEDTVRAAVERLGRYGLVRFTSARGSRTAKYRHLAGEKLGVGEGELAVLALLMLRGPQTPGELRGRSERLHRFAETGAVESALARLVDGEMAVRFERRPGQKEERFGHLLSAERDDDLRGESAPEPVSTAAPGAQTVAPQQDDVPAAGDLVAALEARVSALESDLGSLRQQLADLLED